ncbi:hypothetical protein BKA64DRAFT_207145 [Cadophora sp. MPI-SDFR-AT-0126]|nr:hypothetical protein BKA64DRAFT_207145 [Leotiomycetes sp. MPI-SDFR-AT-0126]
MTSRSNHVIYLDTSDIVSFNPAITCDIANLTSGRRSGLGGDAILRLFSLVLEIETGSPGNRLSLPYGFHARLADFVSGEASVLSTKLPPKTDSLHRSRNGLPSMPITTSARDTSEATSQDCPCAENTMRSTQHLGILWMDLDLQAALGKEVQLEIAGVTHRTAVGIDSVRLLVAWTATAEMQSQTSSQYYSRIFSYGCTKISNSAACGQAPE